VSYDAAQNLNSIYASMLSKYLNRFKGQGIKSPPIHPFSWMLWSWLGAFTGILGAALINRFLPLTPYDHVLLIGSFGASAVLIYGTPHAFYAQPRNLIGGHLIAAIVGVLVSQNLNFPMEVQGAVSVATAIFFMHLTKTLHPPGGATALIAVVGSDKIHQLGYWYVLQPVMSGAFMMLLVALLINNLSSNPERHYPKYWL
jgi:CBS-domain-containing membrane protein